MKLRPPVFAILWAMLWEIWRVTRVEAAWKLVLGTVGGMAVLALSSSASELTKDSTAAIALVLIVMPHLIGWRSMAKLNSGRPGFPLYLLYTRPVRTAVIVGLPMAYLTAVSWAIYLVSALLLRVTSGYTFPLLPVAAWIAALTMVVVAATLSTHKRDTQIVAMVGATNLLLYAVSAAIDARPMAMVFALFSVPAVLAQGGNAFGILAKQGRVYAGAFEATQPYGTGRLAVLKVLVRSGCLLAALTAVGVSVLAPGTLVGAGETLGDPWRSVLPVLEGAVGALTPNELFALAVAGSIGVAVMVASRAALLALWTRYPRRVKIAGSLLLLYGLVLGLLALGGQRGIGPEIPLGAVLRATSWMAASAIVLMTGYLLWRGVAEQLLTLGHACGAVLVSAAFGAAWVTLLRAAGMSLAGIPVADAAWMLSPALLPLTISVLSPWSYSRIRHT